MGKDTEAEGSGINIIGYGTEIQGSVSTMGDIRIEGKIIGDFASEQKLVIGQSGVIEGTINCRDCDVSGKVMGNIVVNEVVVLQSTAEIVGDIASRKLVIDAGAQFTGNCKMHRTGN